MGVPFGNSKRRTCCLCIAYMLTRGTCSVWFYSGLMCTVSFRDMLRQRFRRGVDCAIAIWDMLRLSCRVVPVRVASHFGLVTAVVSGRCRLCHNDFGRATLVVSSACAIAQRQYRIPYIGVRHIALGWVSQSRGVVACATTTWDMLWLFFFVDVRMRCDDCRRCWRFTEASIAPHQPGTS